MPRKTIQFTPAQAAHIAAQAADATTVAVSTAPGGMIHVDAHHGRGPTIRTWVSTDGSSGVIA